VKRPGLSQDQIRMLHFIADAVQKHLRRDAGLQAACAGLQRAGVALVVRLELAPGDDPPRVAVPGSAADVPEWSSEDAEVLRSMGIAGDTGNTSNRSPTESGRQQPR
jgi:hypothetical protein